jgi:hypothetical protein
MHTYLKFATILFCVLWKKIKCQAIKIGKKLVISILFCVNRHGKCPHSPANRMKDFILRPHNKKKTVQNHNLYILRKC